MRSWLLVLACVALVGAGKPPKTIVVAGTLEAAVGQPLVHVQVKDGKRVLTARRTELERILGDAEGHAWSFPAYLDTGSSSYVISKSTAARFGIEAVENAVYQEVGLHGAVQMGVSRPYSVALGDFSGDRTEAPEEFLNVVRKAAFQLNLRDPAPQLARVRGGIDGVGMPAIKRLVIEIDPTVMSDRVREGARPDRDLLERLESIAALPVVRVHSARKRPRSIDVEVELEYVDYNRRRHPGNQGPLPELAPNPMITGVVTEHGPRTFTADWFLDTGAAASMISTAHARALGLYDEAGKPVRAPDFTVMLGGIGGDLQRADGFIIERLKIKAAKARTLEFHRAHVVVRDVGIELPDGQRFVLQGVLGMNLLLPSASGLGQGDLSGVREAPFQRIWVDGPRHTLSLDLP
ncbi:MAG: aspartyl protease family protein [Planctomycetota bacterium]